MSSDASQKKNWLLPILGYGILIVFILYCAEQFFTNGVG